MEILPSLITSPSAVDEPIHSIADEHCSFVFTVADEPVDEDLSLSLIAD